MIAQPWGLPFRFLVDWTREPAKAAGSAELPPCSGKAYVLCCSVLLGGPCSASSSSSSFFSCIHIIWTCSRTGSRPRPRPSIRRRRRLAAGDRILPRGAFFLGDKRKTNWDLEILPYSYLSLSVLRAIRSTLGFLEISSFRADGDGRLFSPTTGPSSHCTSSEPCISSSLHATPSLDLCPFLSVSTHRPLEPEIFSRYCARNIAEQ